MTAPDELASLQTRADKQAAAYAKMLDLGGGVGLLGHHHPDMFEDMQAWDDLTENDHADTVISLLALVREQQAKLGRVAALCDAAEGENFVYGPTVDTDAIRTAITATTQTKTQETE